MIKWTSGEQTLAMLAFVLASVLGVAGCASSNPDAPPFGDVDASDAARPGADDAGRRSDGSSVDSGIRSDATPDGASPPDSGTLDATRLDTTPVDAGTTDGSDSAVPTPKAAFAITAIDFGSGDCGGAAVTRTLTIQNIGNAPLTVNASVTGGAFAVSPMTALTIAAGQGGSLTLTATVPGSATAGSAQSGSLTVTTNDATAASAAITLGVTPHGGMLVWGASSPTGADFGIATLNQVDTAIALSLRNAGNASLGLTLGAPSNSQFTVTPGTNQTLAANGTLAISAGFTPSTAAASSATAQFAVTGPVCGTSVTSVSFSGQGGIGNVTGWPTAPLDFGLGPCGGAPPSALTFTLHNAGTVAAHITSATFSGAPGYTTNAAAGTVPANGDLVVQVNATAIPATSAIPGDYAGTLTFATDVAGDAPHQVLMTKTAQGAILAWDTTATANFGTFGLVPAGTVANQGFSVVNTGNAAADVTLSTSTPFSVSTGSFNVASGASQADTASFTPPTFGGAIGSLALASGSVLCQPLPAPQSLVGTGQQGGISLSTQSMAFSVACSTTGSPATFTITNTGNLPMTWNAVLAQAGGSAFTLSPPTATLAGGTQSTVTVSPKAIGVSSTVSTDTLSVTTDIAGDTAHTVSLTETPSGDVLSLDPISLAFGTVPVSATGESKTLTFDVINGANDGSTPAHVTLSLTGASRYALNKSSVTVAAGGRESVQVTFAPGTAPSDAVLRSGTVVLAVDGADALCATAPGSVSLTGTGTLAQVSISTNELDFGSGGLVNCGATAAALPVVLTNTGNQDYTISGADLDNPTYFAVVMAPVDGIVHPGGSVTLTVTPKAIPGSVASVPSFPTFSGKLTIHTDAQFDDPAGHVIALVMGAKGVIIDNALSVTNWNFGSVSFGSTGFFNVGIRNHGNATAQVALVDTSISVFGLASNPITVAAGDGSVRVNTTLTGTFTPSSSSGQWSDTGTLLVTPTSGNVLCQPLGTWATPTVNMTGSASNAPVISVSGTLSFPSSFCDGSAPPSQSVTIGNAGNAAAPYTVSLDIGTYYTLSSASGSVPSNGSGLITVNVLLPALDASFPGTGPTPYDDRLRIVVGGNTYVVPISLTVTGAVLTSSLTNQQNFFFFENFAFSFTGPTVVITNSGNLSTNVTTAFDNTDFVLTPGSGTVPAGATLSGQLRYYGGGCAVDGTMTMTGSHVCQASPLAVQGCD